LWNFQTVRTDIDRRNSALRGIARQRFGHSGSTQKKIAFAKTVVFWSPNYWARALLHSLWIT
jgi:hypothetical protein